MGRLIANEWEQMMPQVLWNHPHMMNHTHTPGWTHTYTHKLVVIMSCCITCKWNWDHFDYNWPKPFMLKEWMTLLLTEKSYTNKTSIYLLYYAIYTYSYRGTFTHSITGSSPYVLKNTIGTIPFRAMTQVDIHSNS